MRGYANLRTSPGRCSYCSIAARTFPRSEKIENRFDSPADLARLNETIRSTHGMQSALRRLLAVPTWAMATSAYVDDFFIVDLQYDQYSCL